MSNYVTDTVGLVVESIYTVLKGAVMIAVVLGSLVAGAFLHQPILHAVETAVPAVQEYMPSYKKVSHSSFNREPPPSMIFAVYPDSNHRNTPLIL